MDDNELSDRAYEARTHNELTNIVADTMFVIGGFAIIASMIIVVWKLLPT